MAGSERRGTSAGNLPPGGTSLSSFVGRRILVQTIRNRLGDKRLVTLTGVGGTGKTRLAYALGDQARAAFPAGVYVVELLRFKEADERQHADLVHRALAHALGVRLLSQVDPLDAIIEHIAQDDAMLLILDNAEHMRDATAALAATLLRALPGLRILTTSREMLHVPGEATIAVPPLSVPTSAELPIRTDYEAVTLLVDRAEASVPGWKVTPENWGSVVAVLQQCAGIPLAIELAAVRLRSMSVEIIANRLDSMFRLLTGGGRMVQLHHQTLGAVVDWSYDLCTPSEQLLWARLSVFSGGWTLEAAEDVCSCDRIPRDDVADQLAGLVGKSIVTTSADRSRYELLGPIEQYGHGKLVDSGDEHRILDRHRDWAAAMVADAATGWLGPDELDVLRRVSREVPNLRAAMTWAVRSDPNSEIGLAMAVDLQRTRVPFFYGLLPESRDLLRDMLRGTTAPPSPLRASAIAMGAWITLCQGDKPGAGTILRQALDMAGGLPIPLEMLPAVGFAQGCYQMLTLGEPGSLQMLDAARAAFLQGGSPEDANMAHILMAIGSSLLSPTEQEAMATTRGLHEQNLADGAPWAIAWSEMAVAMACLRFGHCQEAGKLLETSLRAMHEMGDRWGTLWSVEIHAWLQSYCCGCGRPENPVAVAQQAAILLGAAFRLQEFTDVLITGLKPFHDQREVAIGQVRKVLNAKDFTKFYKLGLKIESYDHAIALALGEPHTPPTSPRPPTGTTLTAAQMRVATLAAAGLSDQQIADRLVLSKRTVNSHLNQIYSKVGVRNRVELTHWLSRQQPSQH